MPRSLAILWVLALALLVLALGGCRSRIDLTEEGMLLGEVTPANDVSLSLDDLMPWFGADEGIETRFEVIFGGHKGETMLRTQERLSEGQWRQIWSVEGAEEPLEEQTLSLDDDGAVRLGPIVKHDRGLSVVMDPTPIVMPQVLRGEDPVETSFDMRLPLLSNPDQLRAQGTGTLTMELAGRQRVWTPRGSVDAWLIREVFTTDLNVSSSRRETERWYEPEKGLVLERWRETVRAFGLVIERSSRTIVRAD